MSKKIRVGALISGGGSNLQAIIDACEANKIDGEMVFVGSDNPAARGLERAGKHGIPTFVVNYESTIQGYKKDPGTVTLPDDFDYEEICSKQSIFDPDVDEEKVRRLDIGIFVEHVDHIHLHQPDRKHQHDADAQRGDDGYRLVVGPVQIGETVTASHAFRRR